MAKKAVFIVRNDYPSIMYDLLKQTFEVSSWNFAEGALSRSQLIENVKGKFGLICYTPNIIDKEVIDAAGSDLKVVSTVSVGHEHLDLKELKSRGIKVGYTPDVLTEAVAEHAVGLLLATSRRIVEGQHLMLKSGWNSKTWTPTWMCGYGLNLSTVGIVGCGRIGLSIIKKLKAFNPCHIYYSSRTEKPKVNELGAVLKPIDFIMKESDFIIVSLSLSVETKGVISKERISSMKKNAVIVNIGRGGLIDENALIEALESKRIGGAGLDVFDKEPLPADSPLLKLDNVVATPHIASATYECRTAMAELAALNVIAVFNGQRMPAEL
ncbi:glyoxylate reductase/hydroxypyruvate reductase-like isoform X1 [Planococcus citri]|uniref:glyoxylate reductase/hydroxypyruvate reductase-like isoform X1 n=1 Tax=Planococcus citri TaxID=170843 RepID=UPI0031FA22CC